MINALQNSLQKHHRLLLGTLLVIMIGSFVFAGFLSDRSPADIKLAHRGVNLTDARSTRVAHEACSIFLLMNRAGVVTPDDLLNEAVSAAYTQKNGGTVQSQAFYAYTMFIDDIGRADALGVPAPDAETTKKFV